MREIEQVRDLLLAYQSLHDGLSAMIEMGLLSESRSPDGFTWLLRTLERIDKMPGNDRRKAP